MKVLQFPAPTRASKILAKLRNDPGLRNQLRALLKEWKSSRPDN